MPVVQVLSMGSTFSRLRFSRAHDHDECRSRSFFLLSRLFDFRVREANYPRSLRIDNSAITIDVVKRTDNDLFAHVLTITVLRITSACSMCVHYYRLCENDRR